VRDLSSTFDRARQRQDELKRAGEAAATRLHAFEERQQQVQGGIAAAQTRVTGLEQAFAHLGRPRRTRPTPNDNWARSSPSPTT